jgi:transposase-like protein
MTTWTEELKQEIINAYKGADPTPENSAEIVKDLAEEHELSPNGVRQVLVQAGVYVKKDAAATSKPTGKPGKSSGDGEGSKRVSKESQLDSLRAAITAAGGTVDEDIVTKLTGKAAAYFATILGLK